MCYLGVDHRWLGSGPLEWKSAGWPSFANHDESPSDAQTVEVVATLL